MTTCAFLVNYFKIFVKIYYLFYRDYTTIIGIELGSCVAFRGVLGSVWVGFGVKPQPNRNFRFLEKPKPKPFGFSVFGFRFLIRFLVRFSVSDSVFGFWVLVLVFGFKNQKSKTKNQKPKTKNKKPKTKNHKLNHI